MRCTCEKLLELDRVYFLNSIVNKKEYVTCPKCGKKWEVTASRKEIKKVKL